jgi:hypothetical protein
MEWRPATIEEVKEIVAADLANCDPEQTAAFRKYAVEPFQASILRNGAQESVVVVAQNSQEVMYWEDVEEGFNISLLGSDGSILEHWCNQDELAIALNRWLHARG